MSGHPMHGLRSILTSIGYDEARIEKILEQAGDIWDQMGANTAVQTFSSDKTEPDVSHADLVARSPYTLWILTAVAEQRPIFLQPGEYSIGRLPGSDILLQHPTVSRLHGALIVHSDWKIEIKDLGSQNGIIVNDKQIGDTTVVLQPDAMIRFGGVLLFLTKTKKNTNPF